AAPITTHETSYSPAASAVTVLAPTCVPAPEGDRARECVNSVTGLSNASKARHVAPTGTPACVVLDASCVITRAGGPGTISICGGSGSTSPRLGAAHLATALPARAAIAFPSPSNTNE